MSRTPHHSRRSFLKATAAAIGMPAIIPVGCAPAAARREPRRPAPSDKVRLACIGFGTIAHSTGRQFLNNDRVQVVAVCDVNRLSGHYGYQGELEGGREYGKRIVNEFYAKKGGKDPAAANYCDTYEDFREVLARDDIDAVNISTPDHWHAVMAIEAARAGKHIYCQKPMSLVVAHGRAMADAVGKTGVTFQVGSQQRSSVHFRKACELVRNGAIGKVKTVRVSLPAGHKNWSGLGDRQNPEPVPDGFNWEMWLGPAPAREYRPALHPLNWRHNYDYSGGMVTDFGAHHFDIMQWGLGTDDTGPVRFFNGKAELPPPDALYNTATDFSFEMEYANGVRVVVSKVEEGKGVGGVRFEGEGDKWIFCSRGVLESGPEEIRRIPAKEGDVRLYESNDHEDNFIEGVYMGKPTICPVEVGHRSISIAHIANIMLRLGKKELKWDPAKERFVGDAEADKMLDRPLRGPWGLRG